MTGPSSSPGRRLRTKTSDLSEFFRHSRQSAPEDTNTPQSPTDAPLKRPDSATSSKAKRSRLSFLGRTRRKSTHSEVVPPLPSSFPQELVGALHAEPNERDGPSSSRDGHPILVISPSGPSTPPLPSTLPPINVSSPSLGSKFAAHFTPVKPRAIPPPLKLSSPRKSSVQSSIYDGALDSLSPPTPSPRSSSFDTASTSTTRTLSPTPRQTQPTITVSLSPAEYLEQFTGYEDLFTLPPNEMPPPTVHAHLPIPKFDHLERYSDDDTDTMTPSPSPPNSPRMQFPNPPASNNPDYKPYQRQPVEGGRALGPAMKLRANSMSNSKEEDQVADNHASWTSSQSQKHRTISTMPYHSSEKSLSSPTRSCLKTPSVTTLIGTRPSAPPTIPLPSPPSVIPSLSSIPTIPSIQSLPSRRSVGSIASTPSMRRPRAHTIAAISSSATRSTNSSPSPHSPRRERFAVRDDEKSDKENIANATPEQLRESLTKQYQRFDELASYVLKITEKHATEKTALEQKIDAMEKEAKRREKEIKGLRWLVMNSRSSDASEAEGLLEDTISPSSSSVELGNLGRGTTLSGRSSSRDSTRLGIPGSDSFMDLSSSPSDLSTRRNRTLSTTSSHIRVAKAGLGLDFVVPDLPYPSNMKRSSVSSFSSSAASSTSSLSLPGLTSATNTVSSGLSAIPEATTPTPELRRDPVVAAVILAAESQRERENLVKEERRADRALHHISTSSLSSSSPPTPGTSAAASSAYANNLKRGRPPSIAQVLDQSPTMDDVLDLLRPFGGPPTSTT